MMERLRPASSLQKLGGSATDKHLVAEKKESLVWRPPIHLKQESEKWERKFTISTVETRGHEVRSYKGIKASLIRYFLSEQLIS